MEIIIVGVSRCMTSFLACGQAAAVAQLGAEKWTAEYVVIYN